MKINEKEAGVGPFFSKKLNRRLAVGTVILSLKLVFSAWSNGSGRDC